MLFSRTTVEKILLPRMLKGSNWQLCFSHKTNSFDAPILKTREDSIK